MEQNSEYTARLSTVSTARIRSGSTRDAVSGIGPGKGPSSARADVLSSVASFNVALLAAQQSSTAKDHTIQTSHSSKATLSDEGTHKSVNRHRVTSTSDAPNAKPVTAKSHSSSKHTQDAATQNDIESRSTTETETKTEIADEDGEDVNQEEIVLTNDGVIEIAQTAQAMDETASQRVASQTGAKWGDALAEGVSADGSGMDESLTADTTDNALKSEGEGVGRRVAAQRWEMKGEARVAEALTEKEHVLSQDAEAVLPDKRVASGLRGADAIAGLMGRQPEAVDAASLNGLGAGLGGEKAVGVATDPSLTPNTLLVGGLKKEAGAAATRLPTTVTRLNTPFQQSAWSEMMEGRVKWMIQSNLKSATVYIDPPELGPIHIKIQHTAEQTTITFHVNNQAVKEALEQSAHRLRDAMGEQNLTQVDVDVRRDGRQGAQSEDDAESTSRADAGLSDSREALDEQATRVLDREASDGALPGLISTYA